MKAIETKLKGCFIIEPSIFKDERGYFFESFNKISFNKAIEQEVNFVQDNESFSTRGVLRGLHFQKGKYAQAKLVRVIKGSVLDVVVDIRKGSPTFGKHFTQELSDQNHFQLFIPRGFGLSIWEILLETATQFGYKILER